MDDAERQAAHKQYDRTFADYLAWFLSRLIIGTPLLMIGAGMVHLDVWTPFPAWSFSQSSVVVLVLMLLAWICRR